MSLPSSSTNNWGMECCRCHHCPSQPTSGGANVTVVTFVRLCQQLGEPLPTTGGAAVVVVRFRFLQRLGPQMLVGAVAAMVRLRQRLVEGLGVRPSPPSSVTADYWGRRCFQCHHRPSLPTPGGAVISVDAVVRPHQQLG